MKANATRPSPAQRPAPALGKFTRPRPVGVLPRTRLFRALDAARKRPAIWVAAPPGAGKTTLASTYVAQRRARTIWYRIHEDDADPASFFHYFGLAVEAQARVGTALPRFTAEYLLNPRVFARRYFEQAYQRLKAPCILVLDNYEELAHDAPLHAVIREGLDCLPTGMNLIVLSRREPPPAFAAARAKGAVALLDGEQLRLTAAECRGIADLRKARVEKTALQRLHERTQGWTAGLVLALEQGRSSGDEAGVPADAAPQVLFDYFAGDIFGHMAPRVQGLLLHAAFLPTMAAARVVELTGAADADRLLGELARSNYFTLKLAQVHGAPPAVYQFHPLFREFLLRRAEDTLSPPELARLRQKAAALLERDGETAEAVALLIAARDWNGAMATMFPHAQEMLRQGRGRILEAWLRALPSRVLPQSAWALYWLGRCRLGYEPAQARIDLEQAFAAFESNDDATGLFSAWASIVDSFVFERGDFAPLDRWIARLDRLLERHGRVAGAELEARVAGGMFTALMYRQPQRADLPQWAERLRSIVLESPDARTRMILGNQLVHYYTAWLGDLAAARLLVEAVRPSANARAAGPLAHIAGCAMEAKYRWYVGAHEECLSIAKEGMETARRFGVRFSSLLETHGVYAYLTAGDVDAAERLLAQTAASTSGGRLHRAQGCFLAFLCAFHRKDGLHALASAREAVALAEGAGVPLAQGVYRAGLALALFAQGRRREALSCLAQARRIARRIRSPSIEFSCTYTLTYFLLERGKHRHALPLLRRTLEVARQRGYMNRLFWTPEILSRLLGAALAHGIEVEHVRETIRRRGLLPTPDAAQLQHWPFPVRIYTLGRFSVLLDGKPLEFSGKAQRKPLELLMALVAFGGREVSERQLTEALWPDAEGDAAHQACAVALHRLRKLLGHDAAITL